jgi:hypothetical protein
MFAAIDELGNEIIDETQTLVKPKKQPKKLTRAEQAKANLKAFQAKYQKNLQSTWALMKADPKKLSASDKQKRMLLIMTYMQASSKGRKTIGGVSKQNVFGKIATMTSSSVRAMSPWEQARMIRTQGLKRGMASIGAGAINPMSKSSIPIKILGYNVTGTRALKKTISGAVAGFITGGPYGAVAGALAANLQKGKAHTVKNVAAGAAAGYAAGGTWYSSAANLLSSAGGAKGTEEYTEGTEMYGPNVPATGNEDNKVQLKEATILEKLIAVGAPAALLLLL